MGTPAGGDARGRASLRLLHQYTPEAHAQESHEHAKLDVFFVETALSRQEFVRHLAHGGRRKLTGRPTLQSL